VKLLDLTPPTPAENVPPTVAARCRRSGRTKDEVLRLWEPLQPMVVVGRSSRVAEEVDLPACDAAGVPVLRRASGGAAIVAGPGCLMYGLVLRYAGRENLRMLDQAHQHVLGAVASAVSNVIPGVKHLGTCDLAIGNQKFSGNSVRCKRDHLLYHGTLLYAFNLPLVQRLLRMPPRQPEYRAGRPHEQFVANLGVAAADLRQALITGFAATEPLEMWPRERTERLVAERYRRLRGTLRGSCPFGRVTALTPHDCTLKLHDIGTEKRRVGAGASGDGPGVGDCPKPPLL
jgi:lipoate-protein ligase A